MKRKSPQLEATGSLLSCRIKINRADKHIADFYALLEALNRTDESCIVLDMESEPGFKLLRFKSIKELPDLSGVIGDAVHNLMSALDALAVALVIEANIEPVTEAVMSETYFPIDWDSSFSRERFTKFFRRVGPDIEKLIKAMQPYRGGLHDNLFQLYRMDIFDKHRAIIPVVADLAGVSYTFINPQGLPWTRKDKPAKVFPLKDGDILARHHVRHIDNYGEAHFTFQIAFGEGQSFEGEPVAPTLRQLLNVVEGVIDIFARNIFKTAW